MIFFLLGRKVILLLIEFLLEAHIFNSLRQQMDVSIPVVYPLVYISIINYCKFQMNNLCGNAEMYWLTNL